MPLISVADQWAKIQAIQNGSWRNMLAPDGATTKKYLIDTIQRCNHFPTTVAERQNIQKRFADIVQALPFVDAQEEDFWKLKTDGAIGATFSDIFTGTTNPPQNTPRKQFNILDTRELIRIRDEFQQLINGTFMINRAQHANDDLVRALFLCGKFAIRKGANNYFNGVSGMFIPGQQYNSKTFRVHTCMHGFDKFFAPNNEEYYFIPYGLSFTDDNAFRVQRLYHNEGCTNMVTTEQLKQIPAYGFAHSDYACAVINRTALRGRDLKTVMIDRQTVNLLNLQPGIELFPGFNFEAAGTLPAFLSSTISVNPANFDQKLGLHEGHLRYYVIIGRPGEVRARFDDSCFSIGINLDNNPCALATTRQSMTDDKDAIISSSLAPFVAPQNRKAHSRPSLPGMSGGIVLLTFSTNTHRLCKAIGTNWGAERLFDKKENRVDDLLEFTNSINVE